MPRDPTDLHRMQMSLRARAADWWNVGAGFLPTLDPAKVSYFLRNILMPALGSSQQAAPVRGLMTRNWYR